MKKSTIIIALGIFIVVTALLGMTNEKMYQKQKHFETTSEILQQLESKQLKAIDEKGNQSETNDLKECFSERKRLTYSRFDFQKMEIEKVEEIIRKIRDSGVTVVVVSHDVKMLMNLSDLVTVLNFGEKIAEGRPEEIRTNPRVLEAYLGAE